MKRIVTISSIILILSFLIPESVLSFTDKPSVPQKPIDFQDVQPGQHIYLPLMAKTYPDRSIFGGEFTDNSSGLLEMKHAGIYWARLNVLSWADIENTPGQRDWTSAASFEKTASEMHAVGVEVIAVIRGTPSWAQAVPGSVCGPIQDEDIPAFVNFVRDVVIRYSQGPYFVKYWEIQNEPDLAINTTTSLFGCWGDPNDQQYYGGRYYAKVIKQVYPAIKAVDPKSQVLLGGLLLDCDPNNPPIINGQPKDCTSAKYLEGVLVDGGGDYFDAVSFHGYDYYNQSLGSFGNINFGASETNHTVLWYKTAFLKNILIKYGFGNKPLLNTEVSLFCINSCDNDFELTKAYYLTRAYADALKAGLQANVWYSVTPSWRYSSLLGSHGTIQPAYLAFDFAHEMMGDGTSISDLVINSTVRGYDIRSPGKRVWLLWTAVGQSSTINLPEVPLGIFDSLGNPLVISQNLTVDYKPVYVVLNP